MKHGLAATCDPPGQLAFSPPQLTIPKSGSGNRGGSLGSRPEAGLLLSCARTRIDPPAARRIEAFLSEQLDWDYLLRAADYHRLTALLCWNLRRVAAGSVPAS